jgi:hypothetical protein
MAQLKRVAELDHLLMAELEKALAWAMDGHRRLHEASRLLGEAITSGHVLSRYRVGPS